MKLAPLLIAGLTACTPTVFDVPEVAERSANDISNCEDLGRVRGIPAVFGALKEIGLKDARRAAKEKARDVGGNTIVFEPTPEGEVVLEVAAQVYSC